MLTSEAVDLLRARIVSGFSMLFLETWEEQRWEQELANLALDLEKGIATWSVTSGMQPPLRENNGDTADPLAMLEEIESYNGETVFLVKDFQPYLNEPKIVRKLRDLLPNLKENNKSLLFMGPNPLIPVSLLKDAISIELPLPGVPEIRKELAAVLEERHSRNGSTLSVTPDEEERMIKAVLGLTTREAHRALARGLLECDEVSNETFKLLVSEKKSMVSGSDMLEFQDLAEGKQDIGGLQGLKDWTERRSQAFTEKAREQGIPAPKGVLLLGIQGCGKSLSSRAIAMMLSFPLVRLDVSTLLSADSGASEKNLRDVLNLMEMIAPAVLWLDEIEKGFAGSTGDTTDSVMVRLVGRFLTWMQENTAGVFVVATANSVTGLPPEMLRRGRFDELFFIDLPNYHERIEIFEIHLRKRNFDPDDYDVRVLAEKTEGFSGAEIEQIVLSAMVETFGTEAGMTQKDLDRAREETVPLSVTMEEKIFALREWCRPRCRPATPDSRVMQMLEQEQREKGVEDGKPFDETDAQATGDDDGFDLSSMDDLYSDDAKWVALLQEGDVMGAVADYVKENDETTIPELQETFAKHLETTGDQGIALRADPNIVLWLGLGGELASAISKLIGGQKLFLHESDAHRFGSKIEQIKIPMLESMPDERAPRPMWLPAVLSDVAPESPDARFARVARMKLSK